MQITIREAITENDVARFWAQLRLYYRRDIFPPTDSAGLAHFFDLAYEAHMKKLHDRPRDRCRFLFFVRNGQDIGFALPVLFDSEDGKCFLMEFCVYPEHRGSGMGRACAAALLDWAKRSGARYAELNFGGDDRRQRFWKSVGFVDNGVDAWGAPLMLLPPTEEVPITVERLADPEDWQLKKLENGFLAEIGEAPATEERQARLIRAIRDGRITFFLAKRGYRAVGMCSVATCFSTFACADTGVWDDFYIEPAFRKRGIARLLAQAAQRWAQEVGLSGLTATCAPCDEGMYRALGFDTCLGTTFTHLL